MSAYDITIKFARPGGGAGIDWGELRYRGPVPRRGDTIRLGRDGGETDLEVTGVRYNASVLPGTSVDGGPPADFAVARDVTVTCRRR